MSVSSVTFDLLLHHNLLFNFCAENRNCQKSKEANASNQNDGHVTEQFLPTFLLDTPFKFVFILL